MKKLIFGLIFLFGISPICFAEDRFKLEGYNDITDNIKSYQITKADITILGVEFYKNGCYSFKHCYKPMILNPDTANSFAIVFSGSSNWHNDTRREYFENEFNISVSFDLQLWPATDGRIYGAKFIPTKISNSKTTFQGKLIQYNYPTNSAYGDYITRKEIPESTVGPYEMKEVDYKKGFEAKCDSSAKYHDIPMVLKPYAQNIISLEDRYLSEKSMYFPCIIVDEDGNKTNQSTSQESIDYTIYAVVNSLTFTDGTTKTFNTEKIDEKSWVEQNNKYEKKMPWEGKGTSDSPFLIKDLNDLIALNTEYKYLDGGYYFKQEADISISNNEFWGKPQDNLLLYYYEKPFIGHYDGNGKSITGLKIVTSDKELTTVPKCPYNDFHGLFHRVRNAEIKNLTVNCEIDIGENDKAGALAGEAINATFTNIILDSKVKGKESIGGLIGEGTNLSFKDIVVNLNNVTGKKFVGGILGKGERISADNLTLKDSSVNGEELVGGAFGNLEQYCKISNVKADVNVTAKKVCGGVIGSIKEYSSANNISVSGKVTSDSYAGGIFGLIYGNKKKEDKQDIYTDFVSKAEVTSKGNAGGIVSEISENASLSDCVNFGTVVGINIGGIASSIGVFDRNAVWKVTTVERCENHGQLKSTNEIKAYKSGGIAANLRMENTIKDCYNDANIEAKQECGGIVGYNDRGYIENCYAIGEFKTEYYDSKVGGISGMFFSPIGPTKSNLHSTIKNCFITNDTKFSFKGKPSESKNSTLKCCSEEPTYKESYSNLQRFNSVSDIKLDASWNPEVWEIKSGAYPKLKMASKVSNNSASNNQPKVETPKEEKPAVKESVPESKSVETKPVEQKPAEVKPADEKPAEQPAEQPAKAEAPVVKTSEQPGKVDASVVKPVEVKPAEGKAVEEKIPEKVETKIESVTKPSVDTKEYKPVELKPFQTHPKVVVPEELELEP